MEIRHQRGSGCHDRRSLLKQGGKSCGCRLIVMLVLLTMLLLKCPVLMDDRSEQIWRGDRRTTASRRRSVPCTTRVQSMPPADGTVVAADRRQHRHRRRAARRPGSAATDRPRSRRRRSRMQTRSNATAANPDWQVRHTRHLLSLARRSTTTA